MPHKVFTSETTMPNSIYNDLLSLVSIYLDKNKARDVIGRQLAKCGATPETLTIDSFKQIALFLSGASGLYVDDKIRRAKLASAIKKMAGL
jgi:hypothetical protein